MTYTDDVDYEPGPLSCRRRGDRYKIQPASVTCWSSHDRPGNAVLIEADTKGARLILPFEAYENQVVNVSFANSLGLYRTEKARIAWTQELDSSGRMIVGLSYLARNLQAA